MRSGALRLRGATRAGILGAVVALSALVCAAAPLPRDIRVVDLTPSSFSVVWSVNESATK